MKHNMKMKMKIWVMNPQAKERQQTMECQEGDKK